MIKLCLKAMILSISFYVTNVQAAPEQTTDLYSQCVDKTIAELKLSNINNAVVGICSTQTQAIYAKKIVKILDKIKTQSQQDQQTERYQDIMKSQQLWKHYVDQECQNAGAYIGSPMYGFCPMQKYGERVEQLQEYVH